MKKFGSGALLTLASLALMALSAIVDDKKASNERKNMKSELKKELLKEMSKK